MTWTTPSVGAPCPSFAPVIPLVGGELAYTVDDEAPALVCDEGPIPVTDGTARAASFTVVPMGAWGTFSGIQPSDTGTWTVTTP